MNIWLRSLRIRAHLNWRTGKHLHVLLVLRTYSTCSELTPHARIPDTRMPQFMQPCLFVWHEKWALPYIIEMCTSSDPSWAPEARSKTLRKPKNVPAWIVSWPHDPALVWTNNSGNFFLTWFLKQSKTQKQYFLCNKENIFRMNGF